MYVAKQFNLDFRLKFSFTRYHVKVKTVIKLQTTLFKKICKIVKTNYYFVYL